MGLRRNGCGPFVSTEGESPVEKLLKEYQDSARQIKRKMFQLGCTLTSLQGEEYILARKRMEVLQEEYWDLLFAIRGIARYLEPKKPPP